MQTARLRPEFLRTVSEMAPDVLTTLRDNVLAVYVATVEAIETSRAADSLAPRQQRYELEHGRQALLCHFPPDARQWDIVGRAGTSGGFDWYPDLLGLKEAVEAWATSHNLNEPWVCESALAQLGMWGFDPECSYPRSPWPLRPERSPEPGHLEWLFLRVQMSSSLWLGDESRISFQCEGWNPHWRTRSAARAEIRALFEERLERHLDAVESLVAAYDGCERARKWQELPKYLNWLARYQCLGEDFTHIARSEFAQGNYQTVAQPVRELADSIGLTLRPPRRGRPIGSRDRFPRYRAS